MFSKQKKIKMEELKFQFIPLIYENAINMSTSFFFSAVAIII
jgi:hypothetical protein